MIIQVWVQRWKQRTYKWFVVSQVMFDETWVIQPYPTLSLYQYPHYIVSAWSLVDRVYCTIWIVCRLQICCDFNSRAQDTSWKQTRNQKTHNHPKEPSKNMCSCFQLLKLPRFIQTKTNLKPTWCGKKSRPWKIRIWIPWIVPPCCPIVPCALALGDIEPFVVWTSRRLWRWENTDRYVLICLLNEYDMMLISWIMNSTGKNLGTLEIASILYQNVPTIKMHAPLII